MADKTIGALPAAPAIYDDTLLVAEQQGKAVKITGRQLKAIAGGSGSSTGGNTEGGGTAACTSWGFVEMETSVPAADRVDNTLYGLILESYN